MGAISIADLSSKKPPTSYGAELCGDPSFDDPAYWTDIGVGITVAGGQADMVSTVSGQRLGPLSSTDIGTKYRGMIEISAISEGAIRLSDGLGTNYAQFDTVGVHFFEYTALAGSVRWRAAGVTTATFTETSNVEVFNETTLGSNLVENGGFDSDIDGWNNVSSGDSVWDAGTLKTTLQVGDAVGGAGRSFVTVVGATYDLLVDVSASDDGHRIGVGTVLNGTTVLDTGRITTLGEHELSFIATATTTFINIYAMAQDTAGGYTANFNAVSVREVITDGGIIPETTLTASDTLAYSSRQKMVLFLRNTSGGALTPRLDGDTGDFVKVPGVGRVYVANGHTLDSIADGETVAIHLDTIQQFITGLLTITGADGMTATCVRY